MSTYAAVAARSLRIVSAAASTSLVPLSSFSSSQGLFLVKDKKKKEEEMAGFAL